MDSVIKSNITDETLISCLAALCVEDLRGIYRKALNLLSAKVEDFDPKENKRDAVWTLKNVARKLPCYDQVSDQVLLTLDILRDARQYLSQTTVMVSPETLQWDSFEGERVTDYRIADGWLRETVPGLADRA